MRKFNINLGRSIFFPRINSTRCKTICYDENCPWQITMPRAFSVKTFVNEHIYSKMNKNKSIDEKWVVDELENKIQDQANMTVRQAENFFKKEYDAKERIEGSEIAQYAILRDYAKEMLRTNPGSTIAISNNYMEGTWESNKWRPLPTGDDPENIYEIQCLSHKQLTGLPCRHACAALAYQNRRPKEYAHNWLSMGAYHSAYKFVIQPVPCQEYWEHVNMPPVLLLVYKKLAGRPKLTRDKRNDAPKDLELDPYREK
ncbi:hypothetical protein Ahy_A02g007438 [Arachis hypogaea]|uniref:SWIM-type domain-containing protein n=1 Tax=Arachis hypogaea TaxID=3818 RepID=A0A445ECB9_ARAHY|nr:hypothetical protein Ahy_A02g007438 [Arachis hypogaea]